LLGLCANAPPSAADEEAAGAPDASAADRSLRADIGVGSAFPLYLGAQALFEGPFRLQVQLEVGWMPKPYAYAIDDVLRAFAVYPDEVSELIRKALDNSLVIRPSFGWRPFSSHGLEVAAGYTYLTMGGGLAPREVIETIGDRDLPDETRRQIRVHSTLHNLHLRVAWRFLLAEPWVLRVAVEYLHCFASSSGIDDEARRRAGQRAARQVDAAVDDALNGYYTGFVKVPLAGVSAAYRF
jgi:hypothetical protein